MRQGICHIVGAGPFYGHFVQIPGDMVIAADGGYRTLEVLGIPADLVVGDFDSLGHAPQHPNVIELVREKDDTDMTVALQQGQAAGYTNFRIYGGTGGRMDHTLANIQIMAGLSQQGCHCELVGEDWVMTAVTNGALEFDPRYQGYISVFCHGDKARGVTLTGLKFPLEKATLTSTVPLGVSNEFMGIPSRVAVEEGTLLLTYTAIKA